MTETRRGLRRIYQAAAGVVLALVLLDTAIWAFACHRLAGGARDAAASSGWALSAGAARWGGWPVAAAVTLPDMVLRSGPDIIPPLTWTAPEIVLRITAWHPAVAIASASGAQTLTIGAAAPMAFTARSIRTTIDLAAPGPVRIAAAGFDVAAPGGPISLASADIIVRPDDVSADLSGIVLPDRAGQPIAPAIDTLRFDGRISPAIEPRPTAAESAQRWREDGGKLEFTAVSLRWGTLDATGDATLTLDQALQPVVAGHVTATGLAGIIEQFVRTGAMTRSAGMAAQAMLTILSAPTAGGPVTLPMTLQGGIVTIARIPLLRLAPLEWD